MSKVTTIEEILKEFEVTTEGITESSDPCDTCDAEELCGYVDDNGENNYNYFAACMSGHNLRRKKS